MGNSEKNFCIVNDNDFIDYLADFEIYQQSLINDMLASEEEWIYKINEKE